MKAVCLTREEPAITCTCWSRSRRNIALAKLLKELKQGSSLWIKSADRQFRDFQWQEGYAAFSISQREVPALKRYIANQKEHHRKQTFKEELLQFLDEYGIDYDEQYLWK